MRKRLAVMGLALACGCAFAPTTPAQTRTTGSVEQRLDALEARVAALEQREHQRGTTQAPPVAPAAPRTPAAPTEMTHPAPPTPAVAPPAPTVTADWSALHRGMSRRQVANILGAPDNKQVRPMTETWFYPGDRRVQFDRNGTLDTWTGQ